MEDETSSWDGFWDSVSDGFGSLFGNLSNAIGTWFQECMDFLQEKFDELITNIETLLKDLFIPSDDYFTNIEKMFDDKFPLFDQLVEVGTTLFSNEPGELPTFEFELWGVKGKLLDFSLIEDYVYVIKTTISMFLWLQFIVSLMFKIPSLISGQTHFEVRSAELDNNFNYYNSHFPGRFKRLG